ncbi:MAG: type VI secretion system tip protein VgrG, partial [Bacteroidota bacterium]
ADFPISGSDTYIPGAEVEIKAGYHQNDVTIFKGVIVRHAIQVDIRKNALLEIHCYDKAIAMTLARNSAYFKKQKDSDIISSLISNSGLSADVKATTYQHPELVQYFCTDWDFVVNRADVVGSIVVVDDGKVSVQPPEVSASASLLIEYGDALQEIEAEIDARYQMPSVSAKSWDFSSQAQASGDSQEPSVNEQGNLTGKTLSDVLGVSAFDLQTTGSLAADALKVWANGRLLKTRMARIRGSVRFQGNASPKPGGTIELAGLGARFNGTAFVSAVHHVIENGDWNTETTFGLDPKWFSKQADVQPPPVSGLLPGVQGLQIGKVKQIDQDEDNQFRVLVNLTMVDPAGEGIWARLTSFYATNNAGGYFFPEVDDEVVLGFLNNDARYPVILGSLYSSQHSAPFTPDKPNTNKAIITNSQLKIVFDEEKKVITIETPGGHKMEMSDEGQSILIQDSNSNKIEMSSSGILIQSNSDINIKANANINGKANANLALEATSGASLKGLTVDLAANTSLTAKGNASAELSAAGQTTVKGAMVMIN